MSLPNKTNLLPDRPGIPPMAAMPEPETIDIPTLAKAYRLHTSGGCPDRRNGW